MVDNSWMADYQYNSCEYGMWTECDFDQELLECWNPEEIKGWVFRHKQRPDEIISGEQMAEFWERRQMDKQVMVEHSTGALRESKEGKGRPDLLLAGFPRAIMALCRHMDCELGRQRNWEKGLPESSLISSQFRHLLGYASGVSEDSPEYNLTANVWNALVLLEEHLRVQDGVMDESVLDVEKASG